MTVQGTTGIKDRVGGGGGTQPKFGYRGTAEGLKPWPCLGQKIPKIHTLFRTNGKMHAVLF